MFAGELDRSGAFSIYGGMTGGTHGACPSPGEIMPPNHLETRMDTGFAAVPDAPKSASSRQSRRGLSDAAIRAAKPSEKAYKLPAGGSLYLEVSPSGAKLWRWKYRLL